MTGTISQSWRLAKAVDTYSFFFFFFSFLLFFSVCVAPAGLHFTHPKGKKAALQTAELHVEPHVQHSLSGETQTQVTGAMQSQAPEAQ